MPDFLRWMAPCVVCGKILKGGVGIFCGNFFRGREGFLPCASAWCGGCYTESPNDLFPRQQKVEEDVESEILLDEEDKRRHRSGRSGDHLMRVPFECDLCHYRNMNNRDPVWSYPKAMARYPRGHPAHKLGRVLGEGTSNGAG